MSESAIKPRSYVILALGLSVMGSYFYVGFEWLFFVTKPSLLNFLSVFDQLLVLIVSPLPLAILAIFACVSICIPVYFVIQKLTGHKALFLFVLVPIVLISCTEFILIENFTYTMFSVGVSSFTGLERGLHVALFVVLLVFNYRLVSLRINQVEWVQRNSKRFFIASLVLVTSSFLALLTFSDERGRGVITESSESLGDLRKNLPNILIFSTDGLDNRSMSAYGYERETTPFIDSLLDESLRFENHFTNSAKTTGSVGSLLSAKHPTKTRVIFRPDVFTGVHSFEHFPGLLRQLGYTSGDASIRHYVDAHDLNMRESFHYANGRNLDSEGLPLPQIYRAGFSSAALFIESVYARISSRFLHVIGVSRMYNPFLAVTQPDAKTGRSSDRERMDRIKAFIQRTDGPFFANVHLLNTHGKFFPADNTQFTGDREQNDPWDKDFYDNAVLGYDDFTREIVEFLKAIGKYENTVIVLNSDHGYKWGVSRPIPLIIRFPNAEHAGVIKSNSQRIDIPPTLIDYLGLPIPEWMDGSSLLNLQRSALEPFYIVNRQASARSEGWRIVENPRPPFYTLGKLYAVYCSWVFTLDLNSAAFSGKKAPGHTAECPRDQLPSDDIIRERMIRYLANQGYDTLRLQ